MTNKAEIVLSASDKTKAAFASLKRGLSDVEGAASRLSNLKLGGAFGAAGGAAIAAGAAFALFVRNTTNGLDALNDLKDATGASIENISALEDVAARTDTSFEAMSSTLVKFKPATSSTGTKVKIGRVRMYHAHEPVLSELELPFAVTTTTAPSAGGASALPVTPAGYVTLYINGSPRQIAYY